MTFHSFCSQILREFAIEAGLDPGFVILDEGQALAVQREAFETLIRRPPDEIHDSLIRLLAQIEKYQVQQILSILSQNTDAFEQFAEELERDPDSIINTWEVFLEQVRTPVIRQFFADPDINDAISDFIRFCDIYTDENDRAVQYLRKVCPYLHELTPDAPPEILHAAASAFLQVRPTGKLGSQKVWDKDDLEQLRCAKTCLIEGLEYASPYFSLYITKDSGFTASTIRFFQDLAQVAGEYFEILRNLKRQANGVDFNDLIQLTREFLKSRQDIVARHIRPRYQYILVDEFQDTDPAQFEIITYIIGELKPGTRSLFIVGDPKQSIYLFRNADVTRFKEAQNRILSDCRGDLINLDTSFRSCRQVIGCVNYLFSRIFASTEKPWEFGYEPIRVCDDRKKISGSVTVLLPEKHQKEVPAQRPKRLRQGWLQISSTGSSHAGRFR
jgi:ATP-dependent helicase/nuclease subunit A